MWVVCDNGDQMQADVEVAEERRNIADRVSAMSVALSEKLCRWLAKASRANIEAKGDCYRILRLGR